MKKNRTILFVLIIYLSNFLMGCWNYRELNNLAIVAGIAIDKNEQEGKYEVTAEIVDLKGGKDTEVGSKFITMCGDTMFEIARNMISVSGKRLYWSHAKVIVISDSIARDGIAQVIDWYVRDAETRTDVYVVLSNEQTAKEVITAKKSPTTIVSYELEELLKNEKSLSTAPMIDLWDFVDALKQDGVSGSIPTVHLESSVPKVDGMGIFKEDKLLGTLNGNTAKAILFARDEIKGGILVLDKEKEQSISLEIFENKTKIKPIVTDGELKITVSTETVVSIAEVQSQENFISEDDKSKIEERASSMLQDQIATSIKKVQAKYGSDIFGFGVKIYEDMPDIWKEVSQSWNVTFKTLDITVNSKVKVKNSATTSKPVEIGD